MKMHLSEDERWPDYDLYAADNIDEANVDVPEGLYERYVRAKHEYNAVQNELANLKRL